MVRTANSNVESNEESIAKEVQKRRKFNNNKEIFKNFDKFLKKLKSFLDNLIIEPEVEKLPENISDFKNKIIESLNNIFEEFKNAYSKTRHKNA